MNGVSVYPGPKTQNAPTWQVEKQAGRSVIFGSGIQNSCSFNLTLQSPNLFYSITEYVNSIETKINQHYLTDFTTSFVRSTLLSFNFNYSPNTQYKKKKDVKWCALVIE